MVFQQIGLVCAMVGVLAACSGYQPMSDSLGGLGYREQRLSDTRYQLRYVGNYGLSSEEAAKARIKELWRRRAEELCGTTGFTYSDQRWQRPCTFNHTAMGDRVVVEERCVLVLEGRLDC